MKKTTGELLANPIRVAVLGSGAREHALTAKIAASPHCASVVALPGNDGMASAGLRIEVADLGDHAALATKLRELKIDLVVVGPDDLLAAGIVDSLEAEGFAVFGPRKAAAKVEWSKAFAKELMTEAGISTAKHAVLTTASADDLIRVVAETGGYPTVLKYDGLALGKGVRICVDEREALEFLKEIFEQQKFSKTKTKAKDEPKVVVEQFLTGHEVSLFALTDGKAYAVLEPACDHKRVGEGNFGPNTGGMGAYSPVPWLSADKVKAISEKVFKPLLEKLVERKVPFRGLLYAGLMVKGDEFWVIEFNSRFGDPETQAILPRMESDLLPLFFGIATGGFERNLDANPLRWKKEACVNIVAASRGYPDNPETGFAISGLDRVASALEHRAGAEPPACRMYYAGVRGQGGALSTSGGRVLGVSALDASLDLARLRALEVLSAVRFEGIHFRRDIGSVY